MDVRQGSPDKIGEGCQLLYVWGEAIIAFVKRMPQSHISSSARSGRVVVLSGPTRGLGRAFFERLYRNGEQLVLVGRNIGRLLDGYKDLSLQPIAVEADLGAMADASKGEMLARAIGDSLRPLAFEKLIFINNAGVIYPVAPIGHFTAAEILLSASVNFSSIVILADACRRAAQLKGALYTVLNISSGAASRPIESWSLYCGTKAATRMFFDVLAKERSAEVHHIDPGIMDTDMQADIRATDEELFPGLKRFQALAADGKLQQADVVAESIVEKYLS